MRANPKKAKQKSYTNGKIVVDWIPVKCIHSANCVAALPKVFRPTEKPWIRAHRADTQALKDAIDNCPSGALEYRAIADQTSAAPASSASSPDDQSETPDSPATTSVSEKIRVQVLPGGPLLVKGEWVLVDQGKETICDGNKALCRCGHSASKPFCDGTHSEIGFETDSE